MSEEKKEYVVIPREWLRKRIDGYLRVYEEYKDTHDKPTALEAALLASELQTVIFHSQPLSVFEEKAFQAGREKKDVHIEGDRFGQIDKYPTYESYKQSLTNKETSNK